MRGKVWLVGAGPGDPELITVKGYRVLEEADVVVYDRLVNDRLLEVAQDAEKIYVGKKPYGESTSQDRINEILIEQAKLGRCVVRLKGGDPFVFGRGGEEAIELVNEGVCVEVVPGISSVIAVPALAGIPVTQRLMATSFTVVAGHLAPGNELGVDWDRLPTTGTLVILMGVRKLALFTKKLIEIGWKADTPACMIENGTLDNERIISAEIATIAQEAKIAHIKPPAIVVIGDVVTLKNQIKPEKELS